MSAWASGSMAAKLKAQHAAEKEVKPAPPAAAKAAEPTAVAAQAEAAPVAAKPATPSQQPAKSPAHSHQRTPKAAPAAAPVVEYATLGRVSMPADLAALVSSQFSFASQPAPQQATADRATAPAPAAIAPTPVDPAPMHSSRAPEGYPAPRQHHHHHLSQHATPYRGNPSVNYFAPQPPMAPMGGYHNGFIGFGDIPRQYAMQQQMSNHYNAPSYYPSHGAYNGNYGAYGHYGMGGYPMGPGRLQAQPAYYPPRE